MVFHGGFFRAKDAALLSAVKKCCRNVAKCWLCILIIADEYCIIKLSTIRGWERKMTVRRFAVLTDSACDLPEELARQHHIDMLCLKIALDGVGYTERVDFTPEQFSDMLRSSDGIPTTSQVTQYEFLEQFEAYDREGVREVLYISINATGSATNANARAAAQQFHNEHPDSPMTITIVDSHSYSVTYGLACCQASDMLEQGTPMNEVVAYLEDRFARLELVLTAYTLKVIRRSGRIRAPAG